MARSNQREQRRPEDWFPPARFTGSISEPEVDADLATKLDDSQAGAFGLTLLGSVDLAAAKTSLAYVKADVGLGNVDNTSDANKPVSTAQQTALDFKLDDTQAGTFGLVLLGAANAAAAKTSLDLSGTNTGDQFTNVTSSRILGRKTAGFGAAEELTGADATSLLNTFTDLLKGLAPASGGGTANFLCADGTWVAPPSAGAYSVVTKNATYSEGAVSGELIILASGTFTIDLPTAVGNTAKFTVKLVGAGTVTIDPNGAETIDGSATLSISTLNEAWTIISDNANWWVV